MTEWNILILKISTIQYSILNTVSINSKRCNMCGFHLCRAPLVRVMTSQPKHDDWISLHQDTSH